MAWWIWLLGGILLVLTEVLTPGGFYFLFFGAGCLTTALAAFLGVDEVFQQLLLFMTVSIGSLVLLRKRLVQRMDSGRQLKPVDTLIGEIAVLQDKLSPGAYGQAELRGTTWKVRNVGSLALEAGQRSVVEKVDGLTLLVRSET
jgi:membrane protein implicated in regulation of membrane protease activity